MEMDELNQIGMILLVIILFGAILSSVVTVAVGIWGMLSIFIIVILIDWAKCFEKEIKKDRTR